MILKLPAPWANRAHCRPNPQLRACGCACMWSAVEAMAVKLKTKTCVSFGALEMTSSQTILSGVMGIGLKHARFTAHKCHSSVHVHFCHPYRRLIHYGAHELTAIFEDIFSHWVVHIWLSLLHIPTHNVKYFMAHLL